MGDYREILEVLTKAADVGSRESVTLPNSRFWGVIAFGVFAVVCASISTVIIFSKSPLFAAPAIQTSAEFADLKGQVQKLESALEQTNSALAKTNSTLAQTNSALNVAKSERAKDQDAHEAQVRDSQQKVVRLEAQAQEMRAKIASLDKEAKRLTADLVKTLLAAGATPSVPSYGPVPNRPKLPPELERLSPDLAEGPKKPTCLLTLKSYGLLCDLESH